MELHIDTRRHRNRMVIVPRGEIDMANEPFFNEVLDTFLRDGPASALVDLTEVSFMDSTGLRALLKARETSMNRGGSLALVCPPGQVRRLLELAGVLDLFPLQTLDAEASSSDGRAGEPPPLVDEPPLAPA